MKFINNSQFLSVWLIGILAILFSGCFSAQSSKPIDAQKARVFSDSLLADLVSERRDDAYQKMETEFHRAVSREQFDVVVDALYEKFGKPVNFEYLQDAEGVKYFLNGRATTTRKVFYDVATTTTPKGKYYFAVEVVPDENRLAATSFVFGIPQR
jgi:uncharacterized protein YcgL (UPF0745 family)